MKDNKLKLFSLILSAVLIAGGCAKDYTESGNHQEDQDSELPENVFNENITQYFTEVTGSYIRVSSDIPDSRLPEEGDVIVCLATENTPYGYLGRIMSIEETTDGYIWHTGPAALTDAFESLHMDESIDAMAQVEEMVDEDGKSYDFEIVDNSIWDEINPVKDEDEDSPDDDAETKAGAGGYAAATIRLLLDGIEVGGATLSGSLYISTRIDLAIDISGWKLQYANLEVTPRVGTDIEFNADISVEENITLFEKNFPLGAITVGYVVLCPVLHLELTAGFNGEITVKASMKNEFINMKYFVKYENGAWKKGYDNQTVAEGNRCRAASLEMNGELYTEASAGLTVGLYSADMIGISLDAVGRHSLKGEYSLSDKNLFKADKKVGIERTLHGELTFFTDFIGEAADFEKKVETGNLLLGVTPVNLFPGVFDLAAELQDKVIGVSSSWDTDDNLLSVEYGIALLDDNHQPLEFKKLGSVPEAAAVKSASYGENISFEVDNAGDYIVASYVEHGNSTYLGEEIEVKGNILNPWRVYDKLVKTMEYGNDNKWEFFYDEYGRLTQVIEHDYNFGYSCAVMDFVYDGNTFTVSSSADPGSYDFTFKFAMDENGYIMDDGGLLSGDHYRFEYDADYNLKNNFYEQGYNIWENGNLIRGSTFPMEEGEYTYTDMENKVNICLHDVEITPIGGGFKGHISKNLIASWRDELGISTYEYTLDEDGYVTAMMEHYRGRYFDGEPLNYDIEYRLTYYE